MRIALKKFWSTVVLYAGEGMIASALQFGNLKGFENL